MMAVTDVFDIGKSFSVELEYEELHSGLILAPHFGLLSMKGDMLFLAYEVNRVWRDCPPKIGKYISQGIVPGHLLTEGRSTTTVEAPKVLTATEFD